MVAQSVPRFAAHKGRMLTLRTPKQPAGGIACHTCHGLLFAVEHRSSRHLVIVENQGLVSKGVYANRHHSVGIEGHREEFR